MSATGTENTLLIVDDSKINRSILAQVLAEYRVVEAENGFDALASARVVQPDLVLLDIQMPGMDGYEVCERLKDDPLTAEIPIVFITGLSEPGLASAGFELGAVDYIRKPFDFKEVRARVRTHLALKQTRESLRRQNAFLEEKIREQSINSRLARQMLRLINPLPPRYIHLGRDLVLFVTVIAQSCNEEGGDHYLIRTLPAGASGSARTVISLKDQSGHAVNCILRSIITDLLHNAILFADPASSVADTLTRLNNDVFATGLFAGDDFFTGLTLDLDHATNMLRFVSAGHPPFLLIRDGRVSRMPLPGARGANFPVAFQENTPFSAGEILLREGDRLLLFTDGLTDLVLNRNGRSLRADELVGLVQAIMDRDQARPVSRICRDLLEELLLAGGMSALEAARDQLADDVTVIGLEVESLAATGQREFRPADYPDFDRLISHAVAVAGELLARNGFSVADHRLQLVLSEGLLNAWKHGNHEDPDQPITLGWRCGNDFNLEISDTGGGFDFSRVQDPSLAANRAKISGRGIFCIKKYADFVSWRDNGARLVVSFKRNGSRWPEEKQMVPGLALDLWRMSGGGEGKGGADSVS